MSEHLPFPTSPKKVICRKPTPAEIAAYQFKHSSLRTGLCEGLEPTIRPFLRVVPKPEPETPEPCPTPEQDQK